MYAVFEDGSRQYRVSEGQFVVVDYREAEPGTRLEFNRILLYQNGDDTRLGQPLVEGMRVLAEVVDHPSKKSIIQKFRRRKNSRRLKGHRQWYTKVQVRNILLPGQEPPPPEKQEQPTEEKQEQPPEEKREQPAETPAPQPQTEGAAAPQQES